MTIDEMITVLQAVRDGNQIQHRFKGRVDWHDSHVPNKIPWNFESYQYRVKPKPREWWVVPSDDGTYIDSPRYSHGVSANRIKVREVLP